MDVARTADRVWSQRRRRQVGGVAKIVRETYVRRDIACCSPLCTVCPPAGSPLLDGAQQQHLSGSAPHYVFPDVATTVDFADWLADEASHVVLCETCLDAAQTLEGSRLHRRLRKFVADPRRSSVVFPNDKSLFTYVPRRPHETQLARNRAGTDASLSSFLPSLPFANPKTE